MLRGGHEAQKASIVARTEAEKGCVCGATRFGLINGTNNTFKELSISDQGVIESSRIIDVQDLGRRWLVLGD